MTFFTYGDKQKPAMFQTSSAGRAAAIQTAILKQVKWQLGGFFFMSVASNALSRSVLSCQGSDGSYN